MSELIKKHKIAVYVNGGTSEAPKWVRIKKATEFSRSMNPVTEERDYIADEHPTTELMDYKPSEELSITTYKGEEDFDLLYKLYKERAVGDEAKRELMIVYIFDNSVVNNSEDDTQKTYYYADKTEATLVLNEFNSSSSSLSATVYENGTAIKGYVEMTDGAPTFTAGELPAAV